MSCFPFIVGCGRSGTTLLRAMLDSHPLLAIPPESHFVVELALQPGPFDADRFAARLAAHERFTTWEVDEAELHAALEASPPRDLAAAVRTVYGLYARRRGKPRHGDKTPSYVLHVPLLSRLLAEARFVHLIRDGRDVALSMAEVEWGPAGAEPAALLWRSSVAAGRRAGRLLGPGRYREVRYEQLVTDPEQVLRETCGFLDLPFDAAMLRYHDRAGDVVDGFRIRSEHRHLAQPPTAGLRDWRRDMPDRELRLFEAVAGDLLAELGYAAAAGRGVDRRSVS